MDDIDLIYGNVLHPDPPPKRFAAGFQWDDWTIGLGIVGARRVKADAIYLFGVPWFVTFRVGPAWLCVSGREEEQTDG